MPKKGFKSITVPEDLYQKLVEISGRHGTTVQGIIKIAVSDEKFTISPPAEPEVLGSNPSGPATEK
ncbi:MAG: hypothetical protein QXS68_04170 [Candidatus Methanomethylicaceae archaeon]